MTPASCGRSDVAEALDGRCPVDPRGFVQARRGDRLETGQEEQEGEREVPPGLEHDHGHQGHRHLDLEPED